MWTQWIRAHRSPLAPRIDTGLNGSCTACCHAALRNTGFAGRRADARGASGLRTLFRLHFTLSFSIFHVFYFLSLIFFYPKILCQNISPSFLSQNLLMDFFGS